MFRKIIAAAGLTVALMFVPIAANALHCTNESRPAYTGSEWVFVPEIDSNVHMDGNWAFVEEAGAWIFVPPGAVPGSNGNFQNGGHALLVNAICDSSGAVLDSRQTDHGIQLLGGCL
jgi:hypothetical protein